MLSADGSVGSPHVRVGHRQAFIQESRLGNEAAFFCVRRIYSTAVVRESGKRQKL